MEQDSESSNDFFTEKSGDFQDYSGYNPPDYNPQDDYKPQFSQHNESDKKRTKMKKKKKKAKYSPQFQSEEENSSDDQKLMIDDPQPVKKKQEIYYSAKHQKVITKSSKSKSPKKSRKKHQSVVDEIQSDEDRKEEMPRFSNNTDFMASFESENKSSKRKSSNHKGNKRKKAPQSIEQQHTEDDEYAVDNPDEYFPNRHNDVALMSDSDSSENDEDLTPVPDKFSGGSPQRNDYSVNDKNEFFTDYKFEEPSCSEESKPKHKVNYDKLKLKYVKEQPIARENKGHKLLEKMGFQSGKGLGKHGQGRVEPVKMSDHRGRRGLGVTLSGLEPAAVEWNPSDEVVQAKEDVELLVGGLLLPLDEETLSSWKIVGPKVNSIDNMTEFCDEKVLQGILDGKTVFDQLSDGELLKARSRSNPFETLKKAIFLNRAALKMANMDAAFDFMFTSPTYINGKPMVGPNELLYFADVCAGPGGFSEYVLWRKKYLAKGIGFTLKGDNDFNFSKFSAGCPLTFEAFYGVNNNGNIYEPENITSLTEFVMDVTNNIGVHFMMADGGFSVEGQENIQELLSKQLYLCQFLVALCIVRDEGHFVCKLFDLFSPFSVGLVYLMYRSFESISIFKPNTSRPANSERYIICKHKRKDCGPIRDYLFEINEELNKMGSYNSEDITHVVPSSVLKEDEDFYDYIVRSNNILGERQTVNLNKIRAFCIDSNQIETRQQEMRKECLKLWQVPDMMVNNRKTPEEVASSILQRFKDILSFKYERLVSENLDSTFKGIYDWQCYALSSTEPKFYLGVGSCNVFEWNPKKSSWDLISDSNIRLSPGTLVYGEIIYEIQGEFKNQKKFKALHVIDGISIQYEDISCLPYHKRFSMLQLYESAIKKKTERSNFRLKIPFPLEHGEEIFKRLTYRESQLHRMQLLIEEEEYWYEPKAVFFMNTTKAPWMKAVSKSTQKRYFFHTLTKESLFEHDCHNKGVHANIYESLKKSNMWIWEPGVGLKNDPPCDGVVHKDTFIRHIRKLTT